MGKYIRLQVGRGNQEVYNLELKLIVCDSSLFIIRLTLYESSLHLFEE